jgi:hypothetical protein
MKTLDLAGAAGLLCLISSCATQYSKVGFTGGYAEAQKSRNEFAISFAGNGYTTPQRAADFCMLRCAELALGHGFRYFVITANRAEIDKSTSFTTGNYIPTGYGGGVFLSTTQSIPKPGVANTILCFREKPASQDDYFDAKEVFENLSQKYGVKRAVEKFPEFRLPRATVGVTWDRVTPRTYPNISRSESISQAKPHYYKVRTFFDGSHGKEAGIQIGDEIIAFDGIPVASFEAVANRMVRCEIGQPIEVTIRHDSKEQKVSVKTIFNPALKFRPVSEIGWSESVSEDGVSVVEGPMGRTFAFRIAEFADWENPAPTIEEFKRYAVAAAVNIGANGVHVLSSSQQIRDANPNADRRLGFLCWLTVIPKARIGVEFERGAGYENRRVIRRIHNSDVEASGLRIGDNILAINGTDLTQSAELAAKNQMKWEVGQEVDVTVARDGKEVNVQVKTIANR